jgi:hypothetical protein
VEWFSPVIDRRLRLNHGQLVRLLGIDPFLDRTIRPALSRIRTSRNVPHPEAAFLSLTIGLVVDSDWQQNSGSPLDES